jgi:hypothetical protein
MIGFLGPWFCSLFFNTSSDCKKQTHLEAHTYPHLAEDALNKGAAPRNADSCWIIILKVGPFEKWDHAVNFKDLWASHTRGKLFRLERGIHLFKTYKDTYNLKMWAQTEMRAEAIKRFLEENEQNKMEPMNSFALEDEEDNDEDEVACSFDNLFENDNLEEVTMGAIDEARTQIEKSEARHHKKQKLMRVSIKT